MKPGMIIDQVIKDPTGRNLVVQGSAIDDYIISSLLKLGIMSVYIREGNSDPDDPDAILSPKAAAMVKQLRTDDRPKVTLSDSVRQRVSTGVQYIFNNTNSEELTQATNQIADSLMEAINENDAIAVDISSLKTSDEYTFKHSVDVATIAMIVAKQQGLSQADAEAAIAAFKQQKADSQPNVEAMQAQLNAAQAESRRLLLENAATVSAIEMGMDARTIPYLLKMSW